MKNKFDHIVVGGGSSGCVAAAHLVNAGATVLILEAGYSHRHPLLDMPPGIFKMIKGSKYMRYHKMIPQARLNGRQHDIPQANVMGGGSSVNAQIYMRGRPSQRSQTIHRSFLQGLGSRMPRSRTSSFMKKYASDMTANDFASVYNYSVAQTMAEVLAKCPNVETI